MPARAAALLTAALAAGLASAAAPAAAADYVTGDPPLKPVFRLNRPDYTVRCEAGKPVKLSVDPPRDTTVAVGGGSARSKPYTASVDLAPGRAVELRFVRSGKATVYRVRCLPPDFPSWSAKRAGTPQAGWYVVAPDPKVNDGYVARPGYAVIFDARGVPVWWFRNARPVFDADLQPNGHLSWTDFIPNTPFVDAFVERALDGHVLHTWSAVGTPANQHDFRMLPNGNALLVVYRPRDHVDLTRWGGPKDATVLDGEVQEVDPTGALVWSWNTADHLDLAESGHWVSRIAKHPTIHRSDGTPLYDVVHLNSVELVGGVMVLSMRYTDSVYAVDRASRKVLWKLGGMHTDKSLSLVGDPERGHEFGGQHDARLTADGRTLTLYDNGTKRDRLPRALEFQLDLARRTATLTSSVGYPPAGESICCGSARRLPGGNWVVSWGNTQWFTEQTPSGHAVLAIRWADEMRTYRAVPVLPGKLSRSALNRGMNAMAP